MKKLYITLSILLCLAMAANAQRATGFGLKGGLNLAAIDGPDVSDAEMRIGYHLGALVSTRIAPGVMLQPEILFSLHGEGDRGGEALSLHALHIPIMAKVMLGPAFNLQFGPYSGVLLGAKRGSADMKSNINTLEFGVGLGLGYVFRSRYTFDARYMYGLTKTFDDDYHPNFLAGNNAGNRIVQLSLGFLLGGNY